MPQKTDTLYKTHSELSFKWFHLIKMATKKTLSTVELTKNIIHERK